MFKTLSERGPTNDNILINQKELEVLYQQLAITNLKIKASIALNAIPYDYHHRAWWYSSLGLENQNYALDDLLTHFNVGAALAFNGLPVIERLMLIGNQKP